MGGIPHEFNTFAESMFYVLFSGIIPGIFFALIIRVNKRSEG